MNPTTDPRIAHCVARIVELAGLEAPAARDLLQLGYNLGRLSELTGLGREPFWDRWKGPVAAWDRPTLEALAAELATAPPPALGTSHDPPSGTSPDPAGQ